MLDVVGVLECSLAGALVQVLTAQITRIRVICTCHLEKLLSSDISSTLFTDSEHRGEGILVGPLHFPKVPLVLQTVALFPQCRSHCAFSNHQAKEEAVDYRMGHWPETHSCGSDGKERAGTAFQKEGERRDL